ncbi:MAG: hypothetical protein HY905_01930 [Deltaproteobacteria bacterium]|nr:hypothetical protein [Deltaproteobacteria bacterium]
MVIDLLRRIFGGKQDVAEYEKLRPGRVVAHGTIKGGEELVRSPLKSLTCVAFYYRAWYKAQARGKTVDRVVKEAEVYAPAFELAMEGGTLRVAPPKSRSFDAAEHRQLMGRFPGFQATEQLIRPGARVKLHGSVARDGDGFVLRLKQIDLPKDEGEEGGPYRRPEKRRKRRK